MPRSEPTGAPCCSPVTLLDAVCTLCISCSYTLKVCWWRVGYSPRRWVSTVLRIAIHTSASGKALIWPGPVPILHLVCRTWKPCSSEWWAQLRSANLSAVSPLSALPPAMHQAVFCLTTYPAVLPLNSLPDWRIPMNFSEFRYFDFDAHHHKALWQGCEWMWEAVLFLYWNFTDFIPGTQSSSHGLGFCRKQLPRQLVRGMEIVQTDTKRGKGWMRVFPHSRLGRQCWAKGYPVLSQAVKRDGCSSEGGGERALLSRCAPRGCSQGRCCPSAGTYPQHLSPELYMEALKLTPWFHSYHSLKWRPPGTSKLLQRSHTPSSLLE